MTISSGTKVWANFAYCVGKGTYALDFDCIGQDCHYLDGYPGTNCKGADKWLHCRSDVTCSKSNYTAKIVLNQQGMTVAMNETINFLDYGMIMRIRSDGSKRNATVAIEPAMNCSWSEPHGYGVFGGCNASSGAAVCPTASQVVHAQRKSPAASATSTSTASPVRPRRVTTLLAFWIVLCLFLSTVNAASTSSTKDEETNVDYAANVPESDTLLAVSQADPLPSELVALKSRALSPKAMEELVEALYGNLGAFFANKIPAPGAPDAFHLENGLKGLVLELEAFACSQGMYYLLNGFLKKSPGIFTAGCTNLVRVAFIDTGPGEIIGWFVAPTVCSYLLNLMLDTAMEGPLPGAMSGTCNAVMGIANDWFGEKKSNAIFKPYIDKDFRFYDLESDPENCGQVGHKVRTPQSMQDLTSANMELTLQCPDGSTCVGSACTSPECAGASASAKACGAAGSNCMCVTDTTGTGFCVQDASSCGGVIGVTPDDCQDSTRCPSGYVCAQSQNCGRNVCLSAGTCIGTGGIYDTSLTSGSGTGSPAWPPPVVPGSLPKSGWELSLELDNYLANDFSLPEDWYVVYDGKRTVNTKCIAVGELSGATIDSFPPGALMTWQTQILSQSRDPDTCTLALFEGSECDPNASTQHRFYYSGVTSSLVPFVTHAWMVFGCTGLWTSGPQ